VLCKSGVRSGIRATAGMFDSREVQYVVLGCVLFDNTLQYAYNTQYVRIRGQNTLTRGPGIPCTLIEIW
jgi:hypothetical protein